VTDRIQLFGCEIDRLDMAETVAFCDELIQAPGFHQQVSINTAKLVALQDDDRLREVINRCSLINADGQGVVWASRLLGDPLPGRVAGIDLMMRLLGLAATKGYRVYILGARQDALELAVERLRSRYPRLVLAGYRNGYFTDSENGEICVEIRDSRPDLLFVAMSSPKKEYWLGQYGPELGVSFAMGVGGAIDVVAGVTRRAPALWQQLGLEWLFRLLQEPRRMFGRYVVSNVRFAQLLAGALLRGRTGGERPAT
jgi:N-acetylglucosaminyldiphosphoundecaprenol N-acetyl-beta-D-mannosaminyltransferase